MVAPPPDFAEARKSFCEINSKPVAKIKGITRKVITIRVIETPGFSTEVRIEGTIIKAAIEPTMAPQLPPLPYVASFFVHCGIMRFKIKAAATKIPMTTIFHHSMSSPTVMVSLASNMATNAKIGPGNFEMKHPVKAMIIRIAQIPQRTISIIKNFLVKN